MSPPRRAPSRVCLLPPGWGESIPHLRTAREQEQEATACLLTRDLPAARAALQRAAEAAGKAAELLQRLAAEIDGHDQDAPLPDWED